MAETTAIVDATRHRASNPVDMEVAGLGMLERTVRLAAVSGCRRAIVVASPDVRPRTEAIRRRLSEDERFEIELQFLDSDASTMGDVLARSAEALESAGYEFDRALYLDSTAVYDRELVTECLESAAHTGAACTPEEGVRSNATPPRVFASGRQGWNRLVDAAHRREVDSVEALVEKAGRADRRTIANGEAGPSWVRVTDRASGERAADLIWDGCYKSVDGPVSRHINRHFSVPVSRRLAPFDVSPNQISLGAGVLGLATGPIAAMGGYFALLAAAVVYQVKSILDGTDGEIARAKYEFTDHGAWLDKIFDDLSDVSFAVGAGVGVWSMGIPGPAVTGPEFWFGVIALTLLGKCVDSVVYYGHAYQGGELVHPKAIFDWEFEEDEDETPVDSTGARLLAYLKPISKGDVFIFLAFLSAIGGILPVYLALFAVGQVSVAVSRVRQARLQEERRVAARRAEASPEASVQ
jgi:phosphatidylglycerophosphate synthase